MLVCRRSHNYTITVYSKHHTRTTNPNKTALANYENLAVCKRKRTVTVLLGDNAQWTTTNGLDIINKEQCLLNSAITSQAMAGQVSPPRPPPPKRLQTLDKCADAFSGNKTLCDAVTHARPDLVWSSSIVIIHTCVQSKIS